MSLTTSNVKTLPTALLGGKHRSITQLRVILFNISPTYDFRIVARGPMLYYYVPGFPFVSGFFFFPESYE